MSIVCPECRGTGTLTKETGPMWWQRQTFRCDYCIGTGRVEESARTVEQQITEGSNG